MGRLNLQDYINLAKDLCDTLDVKEMSYYIGRTEKGDVYLIYYRLTGKYVLEIGGASNTAETTKLMKLLDALKGEDKETLIKDKPA